MLDIQKIRALYQFGKEISLTDLEVLFKSLRIESKPKRVVLFDQGSKETTVYFIRKGLVRLYYVKENGDEVTFSLIPENNVVANFDFIASDRPSKFIYETLEECSFFSVDFQTLDSIISNNPKLERNRKFFLRKILADVKERVESFVLMNPEERYLKFVKDNPDLNTRVPDKYIANVLGITPVSLSRIRKRTASSKK